MTTRMHYSKTGVVLDPARVYDQSRNSKPSGFWYEFDLEWIDWCRSEMPEWLTEKFLVGQTVTIKPEARILRLTTRVEVYEFAAKYRLRDMFWGPDADLEHRLIDWTRVRQDYDGIEFCNFHHLWDLRDKYLWWYSLDCSSGCVWNPRMLVLGEPVSYTPEEFDKLLDAKYENEALESEIAQGQSAYCD